MDLYRGTLVRYLGSNYDGEIIRGDNGSHPSLYFSSSEKLATEYALKMAKRKKDRGHEVYPVVLEVEAPDELVYDIHDSSEEYQELADKAFDYEKQIFIRQTVEDKFTVPFLYTRYLHSIMVLETDADSVEEAYQSGGRIAINGEQERLKGTISNILS